MRVAVFNRHWATCGGGERYAGALAQAVARNHDVDLLSPTPIDRARLEERLQLDLSRTATRIVPADPALFTAVTREYDLLVNSSFMGTEVNGARRGIYIVLFPAQGSGHAIRMTKQVAGRVLGPVLARNGIRVMWGNGFHAAERSGLGTFRWTTEMADVRLTLPRGARARVRLIFLAYRPSTEPPVPVVVEVDGCVRGRTSVGSDHRPVALDLDVVGRGSHDPIELVIRTDTFVPGAGANGDSRPLGVPLCSVQVGGGPRARLLARFPFLDSSRASNDFLGSYQHIVSISEFTRRWVRHRWGHESQVIYPPVTFVAGGTPKESIILSVGRFFDHRFGHSKKQLELVQAFRALTTRIPPGWELHLVGSCQQAHADYLALVQAEAQRLPVRFHIDATGEELKDLYRRASIYWHAAGLGEDERRHPERLEHFGISTVEAMGAGAVPIVVGKGGQREIVEHGVTGYHFRSLDDLVEVTHQITQDPTLRQQLSRQGRERARAFSTECFAERVRSLVETGRISSA